MKMGPTRKTNTVMFTKYSAEFLFIALKQREAGPRSTVLVFSINYYNPYFCIEHGDHVFVQFKIIINVLVISF